MLQQNLMSPNTIPQIFTSSRNLSRILKIQGQKLEASSSREVNFYVNTYEKDIRRHLTWSKTAFNYDAE